jgi:transcriptional regulator with PAS, ATPase and Fis domain
MKPRVVIITNQDINRDRHVNRIRRIIGEFVDVDGYSLQSGIEKQINCDIVMVPNHLVALKAMKYLLPGTDIIVMKRTVLRSTLDQITKIPTGTKVILVDSNFETAIQYTAMLYELGVSHLRIYPYNPEAQNLPSADMILHPNEPTKIPTFSGPVVNLGNSEVDISTMVDILGRFDLLSHGAREALFTQLVDTVPSSPGLLMLLNTMSWSSECLDILMSNDKRIILSYNQTGKINMFNAKAREIFQPKKDSYFGIALNEVFPANLSKDFISKAELRNIPCEIDRKKFVYSKYQLKKDDMPLGGIIVLENLPEEYADQLGPSEAIRIKGHKIKYTFSDIIGQSKPLQDVVSFAKRVAATESDILIEGETGTGKELLTHAIHNASLRKNGPFVAFNCAALSSSLLESELFGYEEGAFTGAVKGGKKGMFELANGGTILLDEIGEISKDTQIKLLRVLQEREIMRVGGTDLIPINIRVISSTNKDLFKLAREGFFREDLYFRLNVVSIRIPPLRERKEDIPYLIKFILANQGVKSDIPNSFMELCSGYPWHGNVRELKNCMEYMINKGGEFAVGNLPDYMKNVIQESMVSGQAAVVDSEMLFFRVLSILKEANRERRRLGRRKIAEELEAKGFRASEQEIRSLLKKLEKENLVSIGRGRIGTAITSKGLARLSMG